MLHKKSGLTDSDKIFVTVAMWISAIVLFATELTLPMLPNKVAIFYYPVEGENLPELSSKFNNLLLMIMWLIPAAIIGVSTYFRLRHRLKNNFISIVLFSIILSCSFSVVVIYGITRQFAASSTVQKINVHALVCICLAFAISMTLSALPKLYHAERYNDKTARSDFARRLKINTEKFWYIGSGGLLVAAVLCAMIPSFYCYFVFGGVAIAYMLFIMLFKKAKQPSAVETDK